MQATKETVQKRPHTALWVILCVVLLCAAGAALYFCRWAEKPLTLAEGYVAAEGLTADITDGEGAVLSQPVRGTKVTYVVEDEDKDHPGLVRLVLGEDSFGYLAREHLVTDPKDVVATKTVYVRTAVNLLDEAGAVPGRLVQKGEALTVTGWQDMDASGAVGRWQVEGGYIRAEYVTMDEPSAKAQYDQEVYQLHAERGDSWGGGDAAWLDYFPREKASFEGQPMPGEVKALYLNNESIAQAAEYVEVADSCGINAFVVDIMDGGAIAYPSEVMKQYSPSAYESAYNTLEVYQTGIKTLKNAGHYVIGRITAFNDPHLAEDHPECVIADQAGEPLQIGGMYWPSVYSRFVWQYKVELGLEAARLMGFDEIQFDYMRFPDGTWAFEEGTIDYRNENGESKAQAVQRFLMYACDRLHDAGVYVSADVFGECAEAYVTAYGQYWPAISNVVDAISAMPYPDHYGASGDWLPWEHPYETMYAFGQKAAQRQLETASPAAVRTWVQAYNAIREPYNTYGPEEVGAQIKALRDTGNTGGYLTWNGASPLGKYRALAPAFD